MAMTAVHINDPVAALAYRKAYGRALSCVIATVAAVIFLVTLAGARVAGPIGQPLPEPRPLAAPAAAAADYPEQSRIAACWTLANQSAVLLAPRSERSSEVVGPIYADACLGA